MWGILLRLEWYLLPIVGALIGWFTNHVAIRMLFRPQRPWRAGPLRIQGVLPRRQAELARIIAETVEKELAPVDELLDTLDLDAYSDEVARKIVEHVERRLGERLPEFIPPPIGKMVGSFARSMVEREAPGLVREMFGEVKERLKTDIRLGSFVQQKVAQFDTSRLERIALHVARTELKTVEYLGGALGFFIGLVQAALISLT